MKKQMIVPGTENLVPEILAEKIYLEFLENMEDDAENEVGCLSDRITEATDTAEILSLQQELKRARRKLNVLSRMSGNNLEPMLMHDIVTDIAEAGVEQELRPMFKVICCLRNALELTARDFAEARHE